MRHFLFGFLVLSIFSCTVSIDTEEEEEKIAEAAKAFSQAYVDGDLDRQMSFYTDDAVIIPGNRPMISGIEAITRYWDIPDDIKVLQHRSISSGLEINGKIASDYGIYEGASVRNGDTTRFRGQYVITWRKGNDQKWRMAVDMWSALRN